LNSLDESYQSFIQTITQSLRKYPKSYTINSLFASLINEARGPQSIEDNIYINIHQKLYRSGLHKPRSPNRAYRAKYPSNPNKAKQSKPDHKIGKSYRNRPLDGPFCGHCLTNTHTITNCWYLYPEKRLFKWQPNQKLSNSYPKSELSLEKQKQQKALIATICDENINKTSQSASQSAKSS